MKKLLEYPVTSFTAGMTVEEFLRKEGYSKNLIVHLRNTEHGITIEDKLIYTTHRLAEGEILNIKIIETEASENIVPVKMPLSIVYEDEDLMVINKSANLPIHPSQGNFDNTLANGLAFYFKEKGEPFVYRAVNRLDRDTTGLLIIAKHMLSSCILSDMVKNREIHREYAAIVSGKLPEEGVIDAPIARVSGSTIERCVNPETGDRAVTHYKRLFYNEALHYSLAALKLETGRTHQIRVHLKYLGHPLPGDFLYHPDFTKIKRQALHSHRLSFSHPLTKEPLSFEAPIPDDMLWIYDTPDA